MKDKKTLLIRLDPKLHKQMRLASVEEGFSLNSFVNKVFQDYIEKSSNKLVSRSEKWII